MTNPDLAQLPAHSFLGEPALSFHPVREGDRDTYPLRGLTRFGPYSRGALGGVIDPIRVAVIAPSGWRRGVNFFLRELESAHQPRERKHYLIEYPGFSRVFGVRVALGGEDLVLELAPDTDAVVARSERPHLALSERLTRAVNQLGERRNEFDVMLVFLPEAWSAGFYGDDDDFDLHDFIKALTAARNVPVQLIREGKALAYHCRCSVMWRMAIALYCKAGGIPWKLADTDPETAHVGLSYALRPVAEDRPRFVTCCSQVFDAEGAGLEFLAYDATDAPTDRDNPFLSRADMMRVMSRSLALYQRRHGGRAPKRWVVHKSTQFKADEVEGCFDAFRGAESVTLLEVRQATAFRGLRWEGGGSGRLSPASYPVVRSTCQVIDGLTALLWTQGTLPSLDGRDFYKEGKGIPEPLELVRHAGHGTWDESARQVLGLTKMSWNSDGPYSRLPVTLAFASVLARTIKRMPNLQPRPYQFRFFM